MSGKALESAALAIGAKGKPVFPVGINKRPLTAHGFKDATTDPDAIRALFSMQGVAGIGMPTGPASGLVVIDRDRKNAVDGIAACQELEADLGPLPATLQQRTGSGGDQLFFLYPDGVDIPCSAGKVGPGIDIRSAGGYVVLPPSVNEAGPYVWLNRLPPAPLPQSWIDRLAKQPRPEQPRQCPTISATLSTRYGAVALETECRAVASEPAGSRNARLNEAAFAIGQLVGGGELVQAEALTALQQAAAACGLSDHEAQRTIQSGFSAGLAEPRQARGRYV
ncbi:bifunctional DNA primase/polymerase [Desulfovibrionales bacterium]